MLSQRRHDESDARVDEGDGPDDERRHRLVTGGDRPNRGGVVRVLPDVPEVRGDTSSVEGPTEPLDQRSAGPPEDLDGLDPADDGVSGRNDGLVVRERRDRPAQDRDGGDDAEHRRGCA